MAIYRALITAIAFSSVAAAAFSASATPSIYRNKQAISYYCNGLALERLYAYLDEKHPSQGVPAAEQYSILGKQFSQCLYRKGYQVSQEEEITRDGYNFLY